VPLAHVQEKRIGHVEKVRQIYDRATNLACSTKQMKFLLQKFLKFEQDFGNDLTVEYVKKKAMDYVEKNQ
jgi:rRNA biogenesis protein RRP5